MKNYLSRICRKLLLFFCSLIVQKGMGQTPTLTISSDATSSGWTWNSTTRTITVTATSTANVTTITGYLNGGPLTIIGSPDVSVTVSDALNSTATSNGLTIGSTGNTGSIIINAALNLKGPVTMNGNEINLNKDITTAAGAIILNSNFSFVSDAANPTSILTAGGDITIDADINADGNSGGNGSLSLNNLTLDPGAGNIIIRGAVLFTDPSGVLPKINGTGSFTLEPSTPEFKRTINTSLFHFDQDGDGMSGLTMGKAGNTAEIQHDATGGISVGGPVKIYSGVLKLQQPLITTGTSGTIDITALGHVTMDVPLTATGVTTIEVQGDLKTNGTITNLIFTGLEAQHITGSATITNLTVDKWFNTMAWFLAGPQTVTGLVTMTRGRIDGGGVLTLKSDANGTARVAEHNTEGRIEGHVHVERFIPKMSGATPRQKQWRAIGIPVQGSGLRLISGIGISTTSGSESVMVFNESGDDKTNYGNTGVRNAGYQPLNLSVPGSDIIPMGKGIMAWLYGPDNTTPLTGGNLSADLTFSTYGVLNELGNTFMLTDPEITNVNNGWNLVSNPYASPIDWRLVVPPVSTNVAATVYRWDPMAANWTTYNATTQTGSTNGSPYIESGSAFFISAATPGSAGGPMTLTVPQSAKVATTENKHFSKAPFRLDIPGERVRPVADLAGIRLKASGMGNPIPGEAYLDVSRTDATKGWDGKYDGWMMGRSSGANIYFDGEKELELSMQFDAPLKSGEQRYYPLTVTTPEPGATLIDIAREGKWSGKHTVALIDQKAGRTILMKDDTIKYKIHLEEKKSEGRFILAINHVKPDVDGQMLGLQLKTLGNPVIGQTIVLLVTHPTASPRRWKVWDMSGREAGTGIFANDGGIQHKLTVPGMRHPGIYIVQVEMDNGETSQVRIQRH